MIRYYNGGFDHHKLLHLSYRQFLMYYEYLLEMLEEENGKQGKEKSKGEQRRESQEDKTLDTMREMKHLFIHNS